MGIASYDLKLRQHVAGQLIKLKKRNKISIYPSWENFQQFYKDEGYKCQGFSYFFAPIDESKGLIPGNVKWVDQDEIDRLFALSLIDESRKQLSKLPKIYYEDFKSFYFGGFYHSYRSIFIAAHSKKLRSIPIQYLTYNLKDFTPNQEQLDKVDTSHPLIILDTHPLLVIDGKHRLYKLHQEKASTVNVKIIHLKELENFKLNSKKLVSAPRKLTKNQ
jgi:hypothetical protein